jgi:hypothetical protein
MEMKMTMTSTLTSAIVTLGIAATTVSAHAETDFSTLGGIPAEPMNAAEMDAVQGKAILHFGTFSVDNEAIPGWFHFYRYPVGDGSILPAIGSHYKVHPTTGATYLWISNHWFPAVLFGGATATVGHVGLGVLEPIGRLLNGR